MLPENDARWTGGGGGGGGRYSDNMFIQNGKKKKHNGVRVNHQSA